MGRALVIEDEKLARDALKALLLAHDFEVDTAVNPREVNGQLAEAAANNTPYDVILADYKLNLGYIVVEGTETYHEIRHGCCLQTPIIAASSEIEYWRMLRDNHHDPHLHLAGNKVSRNGSDYWDEARTLELLTQLNLLQPATA